MGLPTLYLEPALAEQLPTLLSRWCTTSSRAELTELDRSAGLVAKYICSDAAGSSVMLFVMPETDGRVPVVLQPMIAGSLLHHLWQALQDHGASGAG